VDVKVFQKATLLGTVRILDTKTLNCLFCVGCELDTPCSRETQCVRVMQVFIACRACRLMSGRLCHIVTNHVQHLFV
jgi:hypothetical protein